MNHFLYGIVKKLKKKKLFVVFSLIIAALIFIASFCFIQTLKFQNIILSLNKTILSNQKALDDLKNQDQYKINQNLKKDIKSTHDLYGSSIKTYEKILDLKAQKQDIADLDKIYAEIVKDLSDLNYSSGSALLNKLNNEIDKKYKILVTVAQTTDSAAQDATSANNTPPSSGYSFQAVKTDAGTFNVAIIAADLNSTRVIVDTASDSDCTNNCPVMALGNYVSR